MAKKSRRARKKGRRRPPAVPPPPPGVSRPQAIQQPVVRAAATKVQRGQTDFAGQYSYVRQDLRRIALLASSIFVVLIILSFVLR